MPFATCRPNHQDTFKSRNKIAPVSIAIAVLSAVAFAGCGAEDAARNDSAAEVATGSQRNAKLDADRVKNNLTHDQLAVGDLIVNSIGMVLVPIPAGDFMFSFDVDGQPHVTLTKAFYMGMTEVTQSEWKAVMGTTPWRRKSFADSGDEYPVIDVTWADAVEFCRKLSAKEGVEYRLPTEAQWEYACRAKTTTRYSYGDDSSKLGEYAWFRLNARSELADAIWTRRVAQKKPNPWGLYDMHGNVEEWCEDWFAALPNGDLTDPAGPASGEYKVTRGGSIRSDPDSCYSASRGAGRNPADTFDNVGFRVVRSR